MARAKGYEARIIMPDDVAAEKAQLLEKLGATVEKGDSLQSQSHSRLMRRQSDLSLLSRGSTT